MWDRDKILKGNNITGVFERFVRDFHAFWLGWISQYDENVYQKMRMYLRRRWWETGRYIAKNAYISRGEGIILKIEKNICYEAHAWSYPQHGGNTLRGRDNAVNRSHVSSSLSDFSLQMSQYHNVETDSSHHLRVPPKWKWGYLMQFRSAPKSFEGRGGGGAEILKLLLQNPPMRATYIGNLWSLYDGWTCQILCRKSSGLSMAVWRKTTPRHAESEGFSFKRGRTDYFGSCFIRESEKPALRDVTSTAQFGKRTNFSINQQRQRR